MTVVDYVLRAPLTIAGVITAVLGTGPLLLEVMFGPEDSNAIGLGLLFFFSSPVALGLLVAGIVQGTKRRRQAQGR